MTTDSSAFTDAFSDHYRHASEVVDSLLDVSDGALPDPIELQAGVRIARDMLDRIASEIEEPYALYQPQQVAGILNDFAGILEVLGEALPTLDAAVARMKDRGDVPADAVAAWSAVMSTDILKHGASVLERSARSHAELPYAGYVPVDESEHQAVLIAEIERRGITVNEWAPAEPMEDGSRSVAYIDFAYAGQKCEIRSEEGWEARILTETSEGFDVVEIDARWGYSPSIHPQFLIDEALAAVDRYVAEEADAA